MRFLSKTECRRASSLLYKLIYGSLNMLNTLSATKIKNMEGGTDFTL